MKKIVIKVGEIALEAELNDSRTAGLVWDLLPIEANGQTWGDEIYFGIPVQAEEAEDARADVAVGELGYWPVGKAFCIFFGPTPASDDDRPRAASPVNPIGRVVDDVEPLRQVPNGATVLIEEA